MFWKYSMKVQTSALGNIPNGWKVKEEVSQI